MSEEPSKGTTDKILSWVAGQPFNNVLSLILVCAVIYGGWYALTTAIPEHLKQIQSGYERLNDVHSAERERTVQTYDKWIQHFVGDARKSNNTANSSSGTVTRAD